MMPNSIITVKYEDVVFKPKETIQQLLMHLGLDWMRLRCRLTRIHVVKTASLMQVRQPLYKTRLMLMETLTII